MDLLLEVHSVLRWLIVLVAAAGITVYVLVWLRGSSMGGAERGLMAAFTGLIDAEVFLGLILLIFDGFGGSGFPTHRIVHGSIMMLAAILAHSSMRWRRTDTATRARNNLLVIVGTLLLIVVGVATLPQGWFS